LHLFIVFNRLSTTAFFTLSLHDALPFSIPLLFMMSMTTSVSLPPISNPNLPPEMRIDPGALQPTPLGFRQVKNPLPYSAPTIKPDRKSTRLNSSHVAISYAVFCLKKKKQ